MVLRAFVLLVGVTVAGGVKLGEPAFNGASDENVERAALAEQGASRLPPPPVSTGAHTQPAVAASDNNRWMKAFSGECRSCLKECLGIRAQKLQANVGKFQAPFSLITWYLFQNRPFKMWPIEDLFRAFANVSCAAQLPPPLRLTSAPHLCAAPLRLISAARATSALAALNSRSLADIPSRLTLPLDTAADPPRGLRIGRGHDVHDVPVALRCGVPVPWRATADGGRPADARAGGR